MIFSSHIMFREVLILLVVLATVHGQLFNDYGLDVDDPFSYWWNNRNTLLQDNYATCNVRNPSTGSDRTGVCMHSTECRFSRGRSYSRGSCSFWNICCVYDRFQRNETIRARVAYFRSPGATPRDSTTHTMGLQLLNENVCQIRVDINSMILEEPTITPTPPLPLPTTPFSVTCTDRFMVDTINNDAILPAEFCGTNRNTHFYIHLNRNNNLNRLVRFTVTLNPTGITPSWDIQATQLECPGRETLLNALQHKKDNKNQPYEDFDNLAPQGCLQYFTAPTGNFHSFGWNTGVADSTLTTNQDYAICFKRVQGSCGVRFTPTFVGLWDMAGAAPCDSSYLYTPEPEPTAAPELICPDTSALTSPTAPAWSSEHPGPLYIHFHVEALVMAQSATTQIIRRGFDISYSSSIGCSPP